MTNQRTYADAFTSVFTEEKAFLDFLRERDDRGDWTKRHTRDLRILPLERENTPEAESLPGYTQDDLRAILADTMENTRLLLKSKDLVVPIRNCAIKTLLERAKISGRDLVNHDHPQVIEIWNLVFMQYNRKADSSLEPLPAKVIDTGMGFERLCMALQGKTSNYDTDVFQPMLKAIAAMSDTEYGKDKQQDIAMRVIADHIRTIAFSITDGQLPSNAKAGYVIRRILRRAVRYGYTFLGQRQAFMYKLLPVLIENMGEAYPELEAQKEQEQPFVKQFYVVENLQAAPLKIERFGNLDDAMSQYQALPNHYMKALGVEKNPNPLPGSLDILQCKNGLDTIVEDYKTVPGWDNPYIQNHVAQPLQGALAVQDVELAYELPDAYFHIQTCEDGFDYTLYNKDFTERDGGILETDGDKSVQEAMTELLAEFGCDAAQGRIMDAAELREQADMVAEQQAEVLKEKLAAERPAPEETLSFYVAECLEFTFAGEFHDHLTMEEALEVYDKIPSERMNADKCIGFCIEEDGGFVGMYELVVNDKVQRENINSINYFRDDKLVQRAISDMEKLMAARQQSKEQERSSTKKSVLDALRSLKAKKQEQPAQEQDKPKKAKTKGIEL